MWGKFTVNKRVGSNYWMFLVLAKLCLKIMVLLKTLKNTGCWKNLDVGSEPFYIKQLPLVSLIDKHKLENKGKPDIVIKTGLQKISFCVKFYHFFTSRFARIVIYDIVNWTMTFKRVWICNESCTVLTTKDASSLLKQITIATLWKLCSLHTFHFRHSAIE